MKVIINDVREKDVEFHSMTVEEFLRSLGLNPTTCVVIQNNTILTEKDTLEDSEVRIYTADSFG